jgi:hypothetical protein
MNNSVEEKLARMAQSIEPSVGFSNVHQRSVTFNQYLGEM